MSQENTLVYTLIELVSWKNITHDNTYKLYGLKQYIDERFNIKFIKRQVRRLHKYINFYLILHRYQV